MKQVTLTLLFLVKEDQVLLALKKRGFGSDRYNGVGGKVEPGETIEEGLVRECLEEISVEPLLYEKVADIRFNEFFKGVLALMHVHVFISTKWKGQPTESEEMNPKWFKKDSLPYERMWSDDPYWLPKVLEGKKLEASFVMDEHDAIVEHTIKEVGSFEPLSK